MKLSEAMRKGSKMTHQTFGEWTDGSDKGPGGCALMLAALGAGIRSREDLHPGIAHAGLAIPGELMQIYPFLTKEIGHPCSCISLSKRSRSVWEMILHINDVHEWTAERIAGWIEAHLETPVYSMLDIQHYMEAEEKTNV